MKLTDKQLKRKIRRSYAVSTISISMVLFLLGAAAYLMGSVMLLMGEDTKPFQEADQKLVQTVAGFLGKQMES